MDFCKNLKRLRKNKHISQSEMAEMLGVSQRTISHYENGTCEPNINCLGKIADILETSIDYLVGHSIPVKER